MWQIRSGKWFCIARHLLSTDMLKHWPHVYRVKITFTLPLTESYRFHKFDEMPCKLDSTENPRSFENPQPQLNHLEVVNPSESSQFVATSQSEQKLSGFNRQYWRAILILHNESWSYVGHCQHSSKGALGVGTVNRIIRTHGVFIRDSCLYRVAIAYQNTDNTLPKVHMKISTWWAQ